MIEPEGGDDVELAEAENILDEERLVIGVTRLIERVNAGGVEAIRREIEVL